MNRQRQTALLLFFLIKAIVRQPFFREELQLINQDGTREIKSSGKVCSNNYCKQEPLMDTKAIGESWRRNHVLEQCKDLSQLHREKL
jgi:hypothetical protein